MKKHHGVPIQCFGHNLPGLLRGSEEDGLPPHEAEEVVEEVVDPLTLLDGCHEKTIKFLFGAGHL